MTMPRVFVSGLFHEGHSFTSLLTEREGFAIASGPDLLAKARTSGAILGGAVRDLEARGAQLLPGLSAVAPPGGAVRDAVYQELRSQILEAAVAARPDALFLELHGAMLTESLADPEGDLLAALREALGPDLPIATALDLHAHVTPAMLESATVCLACKENPHSDYAAAGARATALLLDSLEGRIAPVTAATWLPLVVGAQMETADGPLAELHARRRALEAGAPGILDISICNTTAYLDAPGAGQCVTVIADGDAPRAAQLAGTIAEDLWDRRDAFVNDAPAAEAAIAAALDARRDRRPLIVGDHGDRVLAGAPGDDTGLMRLLQRRWPALRALVPVTDPAAVRRAREAGPGGAFHGAIGACWSAGATPLEGDWQVIRLGDGRFVQKGPFLAGEPAELGPTAVLACGALTVLATSRPGFTQDPKAFESNGLAPADFDLVVVKSGTHFKLSFAGIGPCLVANTPGLSSYVPGGLPYRRRRPIHPEDAVRPPDFSARLFDRPAAGG